MTDQRAYLVLGPESSGTRLMTSLLIEAGCYGDAGHVQRWDKNLPDFEPCIVWRRSLPHGGKWPDVGQLIARLQDSGYTVTAVIMSRDWHAMSRSQVDAGHTLDPAGAIANIQEAYRLIFEAINPTALRFELVNYESLVQRPREAVAQLMARLGLPEAKGVHIHDANAKHYRGVGMLSGDVETFKAACRESYGFAPPDGYCLDFISFIDSMKREALIRA